MNISYMYCTSGGGGKTTVVLKTPDIKKAMKIADEPKNHRRELRAKVRRGQWKPTVVGGKDTSGTNRT
ncbi:MAG: hypothetical protein A49_14830 [Methyloceanibacter sp.]|nr:MAG: hypothetical protein A49_14830 [Methyloceanibacter sp.]